MPNPEPSPICGLLNLNKPIGVTSRDVVNRVSRPLRKIKVGHAGTLDPLASGVLVVCVGAATRLIEHVQRMPKTYRATIRLGATSDTLDADGQIVEAIDPRVPSEAEVRAALAAQVGTIQQLPPQFSALKVGGQRAYDLARKGETVELAARPVEVYRIDLHSYEWPRLDVEIDCGSGTYIRSIARDVGEALGCGGLIEVLTRTRIGPLRQEDAIDPEALYRESIPGFLLPASQAVAGLARVEISPAQILQVRQGQRIEAREPVAGTEVALFGSDDRLIAIAGYDSARGCFLPRRVLAVDPGGKQ